MVRDELMSCQSALSRAHTDTEGDAAALERLRQKITNLEDQINGKVKASPGR
jgi:hypothetical protein